MSSQPTNIQQSADRSAGQSGSKPLLQRFGLASIRGRYLYIAVLFIVFLFGAAWFAERELNRATAQGFTNTKAHQDINSTIKAIVDDVWYAEMALQDFLRVPTKRARQNFRFNINQAQSRTKGLLQSEWINSRPRFKKDLIVLSQNLKKLNKDTHVVIQTRADNAKLFPAMPIMLNQMLPVSNNFISQSNRAISEALEHKKLPHQVELYRLFSDTRYAWVRMIGSFRNIVSNRFGIFGNPVRGMLGQERNIFQYSERIARNLKKIGQIRKRHPLEFDQEDGYLRMLVLHKQWLASYRKARKIIFSRGWRTDTPMMRNTIAPLFRRIWSDIRKIEDQATRTTSREVASLSSTGDQLTKAIWIIALTGSLIVFCGFALFEFGVRRPIYSVARALKAEASGQADEILTHGSTRETSDLIDAFQHMREQVNSRQQRLQTILNSTAEGIIVFDEHGIIESVNKAAETLFGYTEAEIIGKEISLLIPPPNKSDRRRNYIEHFMRTEIKRLIGHEGEVTGKHRYGSFFPMALKISSMTLKGKRMYTGVVADISERKAMIEHLRDLAEHDGLTKLHNRSYFQTELERIVERVKRKTREKYALLYIDLDNFKFINDTEGHAAGDLLLIEIAQVLQQRTRKSDLLARFGGDEFIVLLHNADDKLVEYVAESFRTTLAEFTFKYQGKAIDIGCSIGASMIESDITVAEEALSQADFACHLAKSNGRNQVHVFNPADKDDVTSMAIDMGWSRRIKEAIENDYFVLACQPIVSIADGSANTYEVLIRMMGKDQEVIMPFGFLPAAERFGLSVDIDKWVVAHAIDTLVAQRQCHPDLKYTINLAAQSIGNESVLQLIKEKLQRTELPPEAICFEVTESVAISDMKKAVGFLAQLQQLGCTTALDDFGSGFSSFAYLQDLPVDYVKIDGRFVKNLAENPVDRAIVDAMNKVAQALGKQTIAEFVENEESLRILKQLGVDYAQGYHLGRPDMVLPCKDIGDLSGGAVACTIN